MILTKHLNHKKKLFANLIKISILTCLILPSSLFTLIQPNPVQAVQAEQNQQNIEITDFETLVFKKKKQLILADLDPLGRASSAHIQINNSDIPKKKREPRLSYNPKGWHNYKLYFEDGKQKAWLMNRGHLVGYLFSGLDNEAKNLVPITAWLNSGNYKGSNNQNQDSMLYYVILRKATPDMVKKQP